MTAHRRVDQSGCPPYRCLTHGDLSPGMGGGCRQVNTTPSQVLYNGPMSISPEGNLSGQIFNLGSEVSCLATCREFRQTATVLGKWDYKHGESWLNRRG